MKPLCLRISPLLTPDALVAKFATKRFAARARSHELVITALSNLMWRNGGVKELHLIFTPVENGVEIRSEFQFSPMQITLFLLVCGAFLGGFSLITLSILSDHAAAQFSQNGVVRPLYSNDVLEFAATGIAIFTAILTFARLLSWPIEHYMLQRAEQILHDVGGRDTTATPT